MIPCILSFPIHISHHFLCVPSYILRTLVCILISHSPSDVSSGTDLVLVSSHPWYLTYSRMQ